MGEKELEYNREQRMIGKEGMGGREGGSQGYEIE